MMEAVHTSETSVDNHFTRQYNPEDSSEHHSILDWQPVSSLIIKTRFKSKARNISIIHVYAPTEDAELDTKEAFYSQLTATIKDIKKKDVTIVMGDLNT
jgi:exonuclease III